jgi:Protein of unknown function (DUF3467)
MYLLASRYGAYSFRTMNKPPSKPRAAVQGTPAPTVSRPSKTSATAKAPLPGTALTFDTTQIKSSYANFANLDGSREEIVLNFGMDRSWDAAGGQRQIELNHRVILSPFAAKRLALMMTEFVASYEAKYGKLP